MVHDKTYTPQEAAEIAKQYRNFASNVGLLSGLLSGGSLEIKFISDTYEGAMSARNALIKLDCTTGVFGPVFKKIDDDYTFVGNAKVRAVKEDEEN